LCEPGAVEAVTLLLSPPTVGHAEFVLCLFDNAPAGRCEDRDANVTGDVFDVGFVGDVSSGRFAPPVDAGSGSGLAGEPFFE
jgi:hypothetical protein